MDDWTQIMERYGYWTRIMLKKVGDKNIGEEVKIEEK